MSEKFLSQVEPGPEMAQQILSRIKLDYSWRNQWLSNSGSKNKEGYGDPTAFDRAAELYESWTSGNEDDPTIPRVNMIHKAVEDFLSVAITNIPKTKMRADKFIGLDVPDWEKDIRREIIMQAEEVMNAYMNSIKNGNRYQDLKQRAVTHAAIFGVGYIYTEVDKSLDTRNDYIIRDLMNKEEELTSEELDILDIKSNNICLKVIDPRDVFWRHSIRDVYDEGMLRVSLIEYMDTETLREMYADSEFADPRDIKPGNLHHFFEGYYRKGSIENIQSKTTPVITTYELELVPMERIVTTEEGEETIDYDEWRMHKVVVVGNQTVEYESWTSEEGPLSLPITPIYLRKSVNHPYGWSLPLMLEKSEEYINAISTIIFKSARKAVSNQGVVIATPNLGDDDLEEIENVLEEGGIARITGNTTQGPIDIRDMVMPLNYTSAPINPVLIQAQQMQAKMFSGQSQEVDSGAVGAARSGSAKRAQIAISDRPKTISIATMSEGVEMVDRKLYELIRTFHNKQIVVMIDTPDGSKEQATLNETYEKNILVMDPEFESADNPLGFKIVPFEAVLNSTLINMNPISEGRSELPLDMVSRFQLGIALVQSQIITPDTLREFTLTDEMKAYDDRVRARMKLDQAKEMFKQVEAQQQSGFNAVPSEGSQGITPQDIQSEIDTLQGSVAATPSNPFVL